MPAEVEAALKASARRQGLKPGTKRWRAYVYGTLARIKKGQS